MKHFVLFVFLLFMETFAVKAQSFPKSDFTKPVKGRYSLSSDFGEIRPNHFHMGLDIRLRMRQPVYSVADGFISRIKVRSGGYGKALYVDHYNGYRSVYGHLDAFIPEAEEYIKKHQEKNHSFNTVVYPDTTRFPVKKGQLIAYGGNSGRSYGAHLHFEIRERNKDIPVNPYLLGFGVYDKSSPSVFRLKVSPLSVQSQVFGNSMANKFKLQRSGNIYKLLKPVSVSGSVGLSVQTQDTKTNSRNRYAVYKAEVYEDDSLIFRFIKNKISFYETRYLNSYIDYHEKQKHNTRYTNLYREPGNSLSIYDDSVGTGVINIRPNERRKIKIKLSDFAGNVSTIYLNLNGVSGTGESAGDFKQPMRANQKNYFVKDNFRLISGKTSFYSDFDFAYQSSESGDRRLYSDKHIIHKKETAIHNEVYISVRVQKPANYSEQLCLVRINGRGQLKYAGGNFLNGFVSAEIKEFGTYAVAIDTKSPIIYANNFNKGSHVSQLKELTFKLKDNLSGVAGYRAFFNGKPVIVIYDSKNDLLSYKLDHSVLQKKKNHIKITVFDKKGNQTVYNTNFFR
ncbi:MAG: M23 family metallopeptidase [Bacteroidota bacterium]|nr:M23 family metallopeptidase [Bacteroidota bacterium]